MAKEQGTKENPRALKTPALSSEFAMYTDIKDGKEMLVSTVGKAIFFALSLLLPRRLACHAKKVQ